MATKPLIHFFILIKTTTYIKSVAERQSAILKSTEVLSILFLSIFIDVLWAF